MLPWVSKTRQLTFQDTVGQFCFYTYLYVNVLVSSCMKVMNQYIYIYKFSFNMELCIFIYIYWNLNHCFQSLIVSFPCRRCRHIVAEWLKNIQVRVQKVTRTYWFKHMYTCLCWVVFIYIYLHLCMCLYLCLCDIYIYISIAKLKHLVVTMLPFISCRRFQRKHVRLGPVDQR